MRDIRGTLRDLYSALRTIYDSDQSYRTSISVSTSFLPRFCDDYTGSHSHRVASVVSSRQSSIESSLEQPRAAGNVLQVPFFTYIINSCF